MAKKKSSSMPPMWWKKGGRRSKKRKVYKKKLERQQVSGAFNAQRMPLTDRDSTLVQTIGNLVAVYRSNIVTVCPRFSGELPELVITMDELGEGTGFVSDLEYLVRPDGQISSNHLERFLSASSKTNSVYTVQPGSYQMIHKDTGKRRAKLDDPSSVYTAEIPMETRLVLDSSSHWLFKDHIDPDSMPTSVFVILYDLGFGSTEYQTLMYVQTEDSKLLKDSWNGNYALVWADSFETKDTVLSVYKTIIDDSRPEALLRNNLESEFNPIITNLSRAEINGKRYEIKEKLIYQQYFDPEITKQVKKHLHIQ